MQFTDIVSLSSFCVHIISPFFFQANETLLSLSWVPLGTVKGDRQGTNSAIKIRTNGIARTQSLRILTWFCKLFSSHSAQKVFLYINLFPCWKLVPFLSLLSLEISYRYYIEKVEIRNFCIVFLTASLEF